MNYSPNSSSDPPISPKSKMKKKLGLEQQRQAFDGVCIRRGRGGRVEAIRFVWFLFYIKIQIQKKNSPFLPEKIWTFVFFFSKYCEDTMFSLTGVQCTLQSRRFVDRKCLPHLWSFSSWILCLRFFHTLAKRYLITFNRDKHVFIIKRALYLQISLPNQFHFEPKPIIIQDWKLG